MPLPAAIEKRKYNTHQLSTSEALKALHLIIFARIQQTIPVVVLASKCRQNHDFMRTSIADPAETHFKVAKPTKEHADQNNPVPIKGHFARKRLLPLPCHRLQTF